MSGLADTLAQGIRGRCGEPLFGLYRWRAGESHHGHSARRSLPVEKGQLRDAVKSGGSQSTHLSMIHRRSLPPGALNQCVCHKVSVGLWRCGRVRFPADRPEPQGAVWTTHGPCRRLGAIRAHRASAAHRLPTLSGLSPTSPQALQQAVLKTERRGRSAKVSANS